MPNPTAAMLTIGDEILSGRTRDTNMPHLAARLAELGIELREARTVPDVAGEIVAAINALRMPLTAVRTCAKASRAMAATVTSPVPDRPTAAMAASTSAAFRLASAPILGITGPSAESLRAEGIPRVD